MAGNSAYEELKKLANDIVSTGTVSKSSGATSANGSGSGAASAGKSQSTADYFSSRRKALGLDRIKVDLDYINSFISDSQKHMNSTTSDKVRMGYGTSSSIYESRKKEYEDLHKRSFEIGRYLEANKDELDEGAYKSLKDYLDAFDKTSSQAIYAFYRNDQFISQFETEDDYLKWDAYSTPEKRKSTYEKNQTRLKELQEERSQLQQTQPGMNRYTYGGATNPGMPYGASQQGGIAPTSQQQTATDRRLNEIQKEIASIESEMRMYERGNTDESGFYYGSKVVDDYGEYADRDDFGNVSANRNFRNASRDALAEYDAMSDSTTWYTDGNNNIYDAFGNRIDPSNTDEKGNILHPYANNSEYAVTDRLGLYLNASAAEKQEALGTPIGTEGTWESIIKDGYDGNWELLRKDEVDIYYYLLNNSGQETADQYLSDMKTELNRRSMLQSTDLYKEAFSEANTLERIALSIATSPAQMISGAAGFIEDAAMTVMGNEINPYSAAHGGMNFSQTVRGEQAQAWDDATGGVKIPFINFTVGDLYQSGMSAFDTFVGGKLGSGAYEVLMGMGAASTEAKRLYEQGASKEQVAWGGALAGAAEMVFEHASIENLINLKDADTLGQFVKNLLIQGGIEASEEGFTDIANTITNAIVMGSESDWAKLVEKHGGDRLAAFIEKVQDVGKAAFGGFVSGSMGGTASSAASYAQVQSQNAELGQYISGANSTDALIALAQEMAKTASKGDQKNLIKQTERLGKDFITKGGKNRATGRLYNTVRSVVTEQNISEISTALQENGISKKDATAIAGAVAVQANGMELTDAQQKVLDKFKNNENVQNVVNEILDNNESGINQRARSVAKFEFDTMRNDIISRMKQGAPGQENASASDTVDTNKENSSETSYEVSADGKTILKSTGEIVKIKNVAAIKDGKVTLNLEDGGSVNAADVSFSSNSEAIFYDTVAQMDASVKAANILVNSFKALQGDSVQAEVFARGVSEAFRYGKLGLPSAALTRSKFAKDLTVAQQDYVYRQGKKAAGKQVAQQQAVVNSVFNEAKATAKSGTYQAVLEDGITALSLNESQKASYRLADNIAQAAKVNIHVYLGKTAGERGYYNPSTDEIWLNLNATNQSRQSMMAFALGHELVHRAKKGSPGKYQAFTEFLMKEYGKSGASVEAMIQEELDAAKEFGIKMTEEQAFEEVVCNACERMLLDTDAGKRLAEFGAQSKENKSFLEDLKRWISEFLDKLRSIFQDVDPSSLAAKEFAKFDANAKKILADMYVDMTIDAGEKLSTIQNAFGKGTVVEANKQGEFTMARSADGSKVLNNLTTWNNGGRETLEATLLREGYTEDEVNAALTIMDEKQKLVESIANEVNDNGKMAFPEQGRINEATLTTDLKDGHSVLSALVSNGDYPVNIDLLMVCKKRKAYQRVINRLCETGMIKEATVDALAIAEINKILGKYGFETACLGCFVESRRLRIQEWAQTIVKEWNAEVKKRNPKAKPFGFGKGEASLTPDEVMQLIGELESGGEKNDQGNLNLGQGSAVKRMGVLLDKVPTLRRTLSIEDLITPDGLSSLRQFDSNLFSMVKSRYGSNSPKFVQEFNPYNHELAKYGKVPTEYDSLREYLYAIGGARMQSFSDFIIENWFDYCQIVADLAARKLPMHTYTKEIALARLFGLTGIKINMSLIPDVDRSLGKEYAGLTRNAKGELELIWADKDRFKKTGGKSYMQSINFADAIALQEDPRYSANVGTIAVGISDMHIRMMLADPRIRMVIPYHSSGMNPIFADLMGTSYYKDYTNFQNTTVKQLYNSKGQPVTLKLDKTQTGKLTGGFLFNSVLQELGDARAAAEAYKEWCADASKHTITIKGETYTAELTPKFNDFSNEENYYKLLEDFNTYDCITEEAAPQGDVQQIYPEGFEDILRAELSSQEGHRQKQEKNHAFDKAMDEIEGYLKNHTKADNVHYANQHGIKLGAKDKKLSAEDKARLKELQKQGVSFMLPKKITMSMTDSERTEILKDKVITAEVYEGQAENSIAREKDSLESTQIGMVKAALERIANEFGVFVDYKIEDVEVKLSFSKTNLEESVSKKINPNAVAKLMPVLKTAVENAIGIESHANRYYYDTDIVRFENLVGGYVEGDSFVPVRFGLKHRLNGEVILYVIVDQQKIDMDKIKAEVVKITGQDKLGQETSRSAYKFSIQSIAPFVNGEDLLRYLPDDMLNASQKEVKWKAIADTIKRTNDKNDRKYAKYIREGKLRVAKQMVQQAAKMNGYIVKAFHQTNAVFNEFSTDNPVAGKYDSETPNGIFFKTNDHDIGLGGGIQMEVYLNIQNMLHFKNREEANAWYCDNVPGYNKLQDQMNSEIKVINDEIESMDDEFWSEDTSEERYEELSAIEDQFIAKMEVIENDYRGRLRGLLNDYFLSGKSGYDGIELEYDGHRWVNGKREDVHTYIAFDPKQAKSSDAITYDDNGDIIPISQRFNAEKKDIRYNLPVGEDTSPRALLSNALEAVTTNPIEKQKLQEYKEKVEMLNAEEQKLNDLRKQIKKLSFSKGHYDADKVRELQFEANMTANRINTFDKQLLRLEASKPLQNVLTREKKMAYDRGVQRGKEALDAYRERAEKQQQEIVERYQESRKRGVENRHKTIMRQKIRKVILDLDKILNRGDKKRNVKEDMKGFVEEALYAAEILFMDSYTNEDMVRNGVGTDLTPEEAKFMNEARAIMDEISNLPSGSYDAMIERHEQEQKLKGRLAYRMARLKGVFIRERARINKTQVSEVLGNLADAYGRLQNSEYDHVQGAYHENVHEYLKMLQEDVGGTIVKDMTLNQLEELYKAFTMVKTTVYNANRMFAENLNNTRDALANRVMAEVYEAGGEHGLWTKAGDRLNSFSWNNEKPVYAFERIGSKTLKTLYGNIRKGQDTWAVDLQEANDLRKALYEKYGHNSWDTLKTYKFTASSGIDFELNLDQIMSLYAYSKRAQAHDHLLKGGFVFDGNTEVLVNKRGLKIPYLNKDATAYNLSFEILEDIISKLTDEQKAFADDMQEYLSSTMGEKGNEVSMQLYGVKLFNEKFYFPLRSAGQYMERAKEADMKKEQGQINIANSGFSKATKIKASNPVVLSGFMDVWASHVNEMSMYHSFVLPMEDFRRVYNYSSPHMEGQQSASVNGVIQNAYGAAATDYIDKLYRDLNGGAITDNTTGVINKLMNLFKKGAVFASASVTVQQPSAIARATAMVDIKHFIGPKVDAKRHKALWEEVKQYAPVAIIKEMGFFDTNMGRSAKDFLTAEEYSGIKEKALALVKDESFRDELLSKAPALADELTWCVIWEAVKRETKAKHPGMDVKSEEFLKIAGERFSEVIDKTQVYDSVLARSANMRSKDTGMKMATAFMAEPTTSINMVADALRKGKKGNKKQAARIIGSVVGSVILNSFLVAWVYAARDDDEDETFREKYISSFLSGIIDGVNPMTYIPFLKDIVSITQGYDVERSDMAVISDLWNAYKQLKKDNVSAWRKVEGFAGSICQIFGLPVKNIMRDLRSVYQAYNTIVNGEENTARGTAYAIMEGITGQKPSKSDQLYNSRISGDTKHAARVEARYDDEKSANAAVRKEITDRYMDGELTLAQATMQLTQYAGMEMDDAYWLMDSWKHKKETGSDEDYSKYNDFYEAVQTGKNLKAVIQEYTANGVNNKTLQSQITEHFKPEYVEMSAGERAKIKGYLINAYEQCGISREKAEERLRDWDFEAKNGFAYDDRKAAYMNGEISDTQLRTALIEYGGYSDEDADYQIKAYDWEKQGYEGVTVAAVKAYLQPIEGLGYSLEDAGIPRDLYLEYRKRAAECTGVDANGDGKADSNSIKNQKMDVIDSMNLTSEQKDAMYFANGWAKGKLKNAPWH